jgi:EpsI family protein
VNEYRIAGNWPVAGALMLLLLLLVAAAYRDTFLHVIDAWNHWDSGEYYAHGYLAVLIGIFLALRRRAALAHMTPCLYPPAMLVVGLCGLCWLLAGAIGVLLVQIALLLPLIISVVWLVAGSRIARELFAPFLILLFALPMWSPLPPLLQGMTADAVYAMTRLAGIPALQQEQLIILPAGQFMVEESCSGLSYLLAALTLGILYAVLNYRGLGARLSVVMIVGAAAILANILRVFAVVIIGYQTDMQHPMIYNHFALGWYLFGGLVLIMLLIDIRLMRGRLAATSTVTSAARMRADTPCRHGGMAQAISALLCSLLIVAGPVVARWLDQQSWQEQGPGQGGWAGPHPMHDSWLPVYHGAISQRSVYHKDAHEVYLYTGFYPRQRQGSELIFDMNRIADGDAWRQSRMHGRPIKSGAHQVIEQELHDATGRRRLVWFWYRVAGHNTVNRYTAKALQLLGLVSGKPQAAVIAIAAERDADDAAVRMRLGDYLAQMNASLNRIVDTQSE